MITERRIPTGVLAKSRPVIREGLERAGGASRVSIKFAGYRQAEPEILGCDKGIKSKTLELVGLGDRL